MRAVTISKDLFADPVFPVIARATAESADEVDVLIRLIRKFKDSALTEEVPFTDDERTAAKKNPRLRLLAFRTLREDQATFLLETDEHRLLVHRLTEVRQTLPAIVLEDICDLIDRIQDAPESAAASKDV